MESGKPSKRKTRGLESDQQVIEKIGKRIKALRLSAGYGNAETFAFENKIGRSQYAEWERGKDMKVTSLNRIAGIHGITLQDFFAGI